MLNRNYVRSPQDPRLKLAKAMCEGDCTHEETMANVPSRNVVGCLMYLMVSTRPDLAAAVGCSASLPPTLSNTLASTQEGFSVHKWYQDTRN